jgi:signal transduction histidine kinase
MAETNLTASQGLDERRLKRLVEVGQGLVSELDLEAVLQQLLEVARELTGARYAALGILDERREELERFITLGIDEEKRAAIGDLPRGRGVLGELIRDPKPLRLDDVGQHPRSYGFPPAHPPMKSFLGVPILVRGEAYGNLYLTDKEGGPFELGDEQSAVVLADWAAIAIDNARLYTTVWERREELERAVRGLEATTEIARALGGETELERVLELIVKRGRALVDARSVMILLEAEGDVRVAALAGEVEPHVLGKRVQAQRPMSSAALLSGRLADISDRLPIPLRDLGVEATTTLIAPLTFRGNTVGMLLAFDRLAGDLHFTREDESLMRSFAASAATAVHTARAVAEDRLRQSIEASEQERQRWARELHDDTLQGLGGLRVLLSSARRGGSETLESAVDQAIEELGSQIENLRALIVELRPATLDEIGLQPAIDSLAKRTEAVHGLRVTTDIDLTHEIGEASSRLSPEIETTVYRVVQEALTNAVKHGAARSAEVSISDRAGKVEVCVSDDGVGFDPKAAADGFGLAGMSERLELVGGELEVSSSPGKGTAIRAVLPVARAGD